MHIVFIVGSYFPYYSAVGKCVGNVADEISIKHKVTIMAQKNFIKQSEEEVFNKQNIIRVDSNENRIRNKLNENIILNTGLKKNINKLSLLAYKSFTVFSSLFSFTSTKKQLINEYLHALENIEDRIDVIVPACMPFESIVAAINYKKNNSNVKIIPYLFDQFVENKTLNRNTFNMKIKRKSNLMLEKYMMENSESVLIMDQLEAHFKKEFYSSYNKIKIVEHPLIKKYLKANNEVNNNEINIIYAGSFYKDIRNPKYFLDLVTKSLITINFNMNIYSFGNCEEIVSEYSRANKSIIAHGKVSNDKAYDAINKSDILIALGNTNTNQVPSKIFEYISFGKPIIYFYFEDGDKNLQILRKYPLSLCLKQDYDNLSDNVKKFNNFCSENYKKRIAFEQVEKIFYDATPKYTANIIEKIIKY